MATILIVDDEESIRDSLSALVGNGGHLVWAAADGYEATRRFPKERADLAIVDMIMPQKGGLETIAELRKMNPALKVIAVSGAAKTGRGRLLEWAKRVGADRVFSKPFVISDLLDAVTTLLREHEREVPRQNPPAN